MAHIPVYGISSFKGAVPDPSFYANVLSVHLESHQFINHPHSHNTYITVLFTEGTGIHQIDFETYPVHPWAVFVLSPGQVHAWQLSADTEGYVFFHTATFYNDIYIGHKLEDFPFFYLSQNYPMIEVVESSRSYVRQLFADILIEQSFQLPFREAKLCNLVNLVYISLSRMYKNIEKHEEPENHIRVRKLQKLIDLHFKTYKQPSDYAKLMNMTTRHLSRICNEVMGQSTGNLIQERVLLEAKRLLTYGKEPVADIAYTLGYDDVSYFIRLFKQKTTLTPKAFRESLHA